MIVVSCVAKELILATYSAVSLRKLLRHFRKERYIFTNRQYVFMAPPTVVLRLLLRMFYTVYLLIVNPYPLPDAKLDLAHCCVATINCCYQYSDIDFCLSIITVFFLLYYTSITFN